MRMSATLSAVAIRPHHPGPKTFGNGAGIPRTTLIRNPVSRRSLRKLRKVNSRV